jgi:hypothetical protein
LNAVSFRGDFPLSLKKPEKPQEEIDPVQGLRAELIKFTYETLNSKQ